MAIRLCMIGCGGFARLCHGPAQQRLANTDADVVLAGCCDVDPKAAQDFATQFGYGRAYTNTEAMLTTETPDAVIIAVPPLLTCAVAAPVLARGFPVLLEKPPGLTVQELDRLIAAHLQGGAVVQVALNRRYMPLMQRAREIIAAEFAATGVTRVDYDMVRCNRWNEDFSTTAIHALDALRFLAGVPFTAAEISYEGRHEIGRRAVDVCVRAPAGFTQLTLNVLPVSGRNSESARIYGPGKLLELRIPASPQATEPGALEYWSDGKRVESYSDEGTEMVERMGVAGELVAFIECVRQGKPVTPALADCRQQVALMEAIRDSVPSVEFTA